MSGTTTTAPAALEALAVLLRALKLPTVARHADEVADKAEHEGWSFAQYLRHLMALEVEERRRRRIERNQRDSELPGEKTLATLDRKRLPTTAAKMLPTLCEGTFLARGDNVLLFGLPGRGKTHVACAIGHDLVRRGHRVLFTPTYALVQRLLAAKRDLRLEVELGVLDGFDAVILDDIGYVQQNRDEMEVLFTFLAERYERKSVLITSNLVFSEWDRIFKDPMTTAAAIDRLVHHAVILELTGKSKRAEDAEDALKEVKATTATTPTPTKGKGK
jgi:DNA replication protein DnaC